MALKDYSLTTVARFKTYADISGSTDDTLIENLINQVTEFIENYIGRRLKLTTYTNEEYDGSGTFKLILKNYPVGTFTNLQERSTRQNSADWNIIESDNYFVDTTNGIITLIPYEFTEGTKLYRVNYTAGYDFDNSTTFLGDTEAGDLEWVAWRLLSTVFNKNSQDPNISSVRLGDASVSYRSTTMEDGNIKSVLDKYRQVTL